MFDMTPVYMCTECASWIENGDATSLDYHYPEDEAAARLKEIQDGEDELIQDGYQAMAGDTNQDLEFSHERCACCDTTLAGYRHRMVLVKSTD